MKLFLLAGVHGGFKIEIRLGSGATEVVNEEEFNHQLEELQQAMKYARKEVAWLNDDNQMENAEGIVYDRVQDRSIRGPRKTFSTSSTEKSPSEPSSATPSPSSAARRQKSAKR